MRTLLAIASVAFFCTNIGCAKNEEEPTEEEAKKIQGPTFGSIKSRTDKGLNGTIRIADQSLRVSGGSPIHSVGSADRWLACKAPSDHD